MSTIVRLSVNGVSQELIARPGMSLLTALRDVLGQAGTRRGCEQGGCGSCTVAVDGVAKLACLVPVESLAGAHVVTVEGVGSDAKLDPIQQAFLDHFATQCGFCTPGMIMATRALLERNAHPSREEAIAAISGNICRCTGYQPIVDAIVALSETARTAGASAGQGGRR